MNPEVEKRSRAEGVLAAVTSLMLRIGVVVALGYVLWRVRFIIIVVLISMMLALAAAPVVARLHASRLLRFVPQSLRQGAATTLVFVIAGLLLVQIGFLILRPLALELGEFRDNWGAYQKQLTDLWQWFQTQYGTLPEDVRLWVEQQEFKDLGARAAAQVQHLLTRTIESGMFLVELILIPVLAFSFLTESRPLKREFALLLPRSKLRDGLYVHRKASQILQSYALGQLVLALIAGVVVWLLMVTLGIRYALALAVIAAFTRVIPVIGPIIGGIPIVLLSSLQGWERGLTVLVAFCVMHVVESKVVMPRLIGYRIELHPAVVIVVLLIGAEFFGMWGMFLAAPVAAVAKALLHHFYVRPRLPGRRRRPATEAAFPREEPEIERPAVAGARGHSGAH